MPRLIRGRYEVLEVVASGGQGDLIRALDRQHDRILALKVRRVGDRTQREAVLSEARILLGLRPHPGVTLVREDFFERDRYYLAMDWVEGTDLRRLLVERGSPGLPFDHVMGWLTEVAGALDHLHGHEPPIVHGDVKPANVIITPQGRAVLVDFGIAFRGEPGRTAAGTPGYLAPEVLSGGRPGPASDVFGLAATASTLLTGTHPELGVRPDWSALPEAHAERVGAALRRGLALDPGRRPRSAGELMRLLAPPATPTNLPAPMTSFLGREEELAELGRLLEEVRLLTITGPGGAGKTRLAVELALRAMSDHPDGVWLVDLAAVRDPTLVAHAVARAAGAREERGRPILDTLRALLEPRRVLLVVDNCEHLVEAAAGTVAELLAACPGLRVIATSREPLGVPGETMWTVPSLSLPPTDAAAPADLFGSEAVRLLVERGRAASPGFAVTHENAAAVAQICLRLDGLPLAIELAAARLRALPPDEVARRLDDRFRLLTGGSRGALPRHQTLLAAMEWSHDLLSEPERVLLRRLSAFAGGFGLDAAESVCSDDAGPKDTLERRDVLDLLAHLVDRSLVVAEERDGEARYRMLETVRQFALQKLDEAGEERSLRDRHLSVCLELARRARPELTGARQTWWLHRLEADQDNLRAALQWGLGREEAGGAELAVSLWRFWYARGELTEGRRWLEATLAIPDLDPRLRAEALTGAASLVNDLGDTAAARSLSERSLELWGELGDREGIARALNNTANALWDEGDFGGSRSLLEESLRIRRELGDTRGVALGLNNLGNAAWGQGDIAGARGFYRESLELSREVEDPRGVGFALSNLADLEWEAGAPAAARALYVESLRVRLEVGDKVGMTYCLIGLAAVASSEGDHERAAALFGAAEALRTRIGAWLSPAEEALWAPPRDRAREALGEEAFAEAWSDGQSWSLDEAVARAFDAPPPP